MLDGIPIGHKDIYKTAGIRTTAHSKLLVENVPEQDAVTVKLWAEAGTVLMGKLATHEFALGGPSFDLPWPAVRNPWDTDAFYRGQQQRHWGGGGGGADHGGNGVGYGRLHPRPVGSMRDCRDQADLWADQPHGDLAAVLHLGPCRADGVDGGGLRVAAAGDGRA